MPVPLPVAFQWVSLLLAAWVARLEQASVNYLREENRVLRERLGKRRLYLTDAQRIRLATRAKALGWSQTQRVATIVTPATLFRWYRELVAKKYTPERSVRRGGKPQTPADVEGMVLRAARENPGWGYRRIVGALKNLGQEVSKTTVARILKRNGVPNAPERLKRGITWRQFLSSHAVYAADFFTVEVLSLRRLARYHVFFVIELATRRAHLAGIRRLPNGAWATQVARNLTDYEDGFLRDAKYLILDRDPLFCRSFRTVLESAGVKIVRLPPRSPNLNAYAERFVRSVRQECLSQVIPLSERHLRRTLEDYFAHYNTERNHQSLGNELIDPEPGVGSGVGKVRSRTRLGGILRYYFRRAAA